MMSGKKRGWHDFQFGSEKIDERKGALEKIELSVTLFRQLINNEQWRMEGPQ